MRKVTVKCPVDFTDGASNWASGRARNTPAKRRIWQTGCKTGMEDVGKIVFPASAPAGQFEAVLSWRLLVSSLDFRFTQPGTLHCLAS